MEEFHVAGRDSRWNRDGKVKFKNDDLKRLDEEITKCHERYNHWMDHWSSNYYDNVIPGELLFRKESMKISMELCFEDAHKLIEGLNHASLDTLSEKRGIRLVGRCLDNIFELRCDIEDAANGFFRRAIEYQTVECPQTILEDWMSFQKFVFDGPQLSDYDADKLCALDLGKQKSNFSHLDWERDTSSDRITELDIRRQIEAEYDSRRSEFEPAKLPPVPESPISSQKRRKITEN